MKEEIDIMSMLDWSMPIEIQERGKFLAKKVDDISLFLQPVTPRHHKNVWQNCAMVVTEKSDEELRKYLRELLEWIQDMNWPGAFCIFNRLLKYTDEQSFACSLKKCKEKARSKNDIVWLNNLNSLESTRKSSIDGDTGIDFMR